MGTAPMASPRANSPLRVPPYSRPPLVGSCIGGLGRSQSPLCKGPWPHLAAHLQVAKPWPAAPLQVAKPWPAAPLQVAKPRPAAPVGGLAAHSPPRCVYPDREDEGGQASSSLAISTRWISIAKLLQSDLATLAQRDGGE
ncbi:hypothetical protein GW17_00055169 [Ensete ventricosum]|nr:hypothetical protein GW17_00055169 [Ensete ventricosum]